MRLQAKIQQREPTEGEERGGGMGKIKRVHSHGQANSRVPNRGWDLKEGREEVHYGTRS